MLQVVLSFLKDQVNNYLRVKRRGQPFVVDVVFREQHTGSTIKFFENKINVLLVNLEEEQLFRAGAVPSSSITNGINAQVNPDVYMNLYIMFVSYFKDDYTQALSCLSLIIKFFQSHRLFEGKNYPPLNPEIEKLTLELVNLPFSEQKDLWSLLGMPYIPSVIYKVRMVVFKDRDTLEVTTPIEETQLISSQI